MEQYLKASTLLDEFIKLNPDLKTVKVKYKLYKLLCLEFNRKSVKTFNGKKIKVVI
jgi:hypothetical protein